MAESVAPLVDASGFMISLRGRGRLQGELPPGVSYLDRALPARPLFAAWERWYWPDLHWLLRHFDVVHGTNFVVPPVTGTATVATVHDLTPLLYPRLCRPEVLAFPVMVQHAVKAGAWIHTPSEFVRHQVLEHFSVDPERVVTIAHGVTPLPLGSLEAPTAKLLDGHPYILALSTLEPRKGLVYLIQAFAQLASRYRDLRLVLTGQAGWGVDGLLASIGATSVAERVLLPGYVSQNERSWLLRHAAVFAYPSLYEGFGLPTLEAMSVGTPVVTTTGGAIPEVVGSGASLVAPRSVDQLTAALDQVLSDQGFAASLRQRGLARAGLYSWERVGRQMVELYARAAGS